MEEVVGYLLYVDGKALGAGKSLEDAKTLAKEYIASDLRIETRASPPGPVRTWNFDVALDSWVESK
jgi:hypothetical protein